MKTPIALAAFVAAGLTSSFAMAADFGGGYAEEDDVFVQQTLPRPVLIARPYNDLYEENGVYYAPPHPLPYFGLFPNWGPLYAAPEVYVRTRVEHRRIYRETSSGRRYR
ncbi:hypothetical protein [Hyphomicrobium sp. 2TAF46]|uniref:hypothetical protein n=1 Tax=Hyphomicrobium sp. 2TAF46 TaxID=3233019 RepID=UPI003F91040D